jgi:hypothetical protein
MLLIVDDVELRFLRTGLNGQTVLDAERDDLEPVHSVCAAARGAAEDRAPRFAAVGRQHRYPRYASRF